ncbi:hypothetical protein [Enterococcus sp. AZ051]|uniref:hypothetical protein n=1 Tax=Enterococcus sp. AZ051 TaxID=2774698 RepID=UPI003D2A366F
MFLKKNNKRQYHRECEKLILDFYHRAFLQIVDIHLKESTSEDLLVAQRAINCLDTNLFMLDSQWIKGKKKEDVRNRLLSMGEAFDLHSLQ